MKSNTVTCTVNKPKKEVFEFLSKVENLPKWSSEFVKEINLVDGKYIAKIPACLLGRYQNTEDGKLILVSAMTPTPKGEGKTTNTVGLGQALFKLGKKTMIKHFEDLYKIHLKSNQSFERFLQICWNEAKKTQKNN